jgi:hypothetical protein
MRLAEIQDAIHEAKEVLVHVVIAEANGGTSYHFPVSKVEARRMVFAQVSAGKSLEFIASYDADSKVLYIG